MQIFDVRAIQRMIGDDPAALREFIAIVLRDLPGQIDRLEAALQAGDPIAASREAHAVKGTAVLVGGEVLAEISRHLEQAGLEGDLQRLRADFPRLRSAAEELARELERARTT